MAQIADGGSTETAAQRNARLQAAFNKTSTSTKTTTSTYVPAPSYTPPPTYVPAPSYTPPKVPETYNVQDIQSQPAYTPPPTPAPAPTQNLDQRLYNVQDIQAQVTAASTFYDVQSIQSQAATPSTFYDVQSIQGTQQQPQQISGATPTEQAAAQGGGVPAQIDPYFADLSSGMQYLYSQFPENVGGVGTPTELRAGGGYGPSSYQWSESPASLSELAQGRTPVGPALAAATTVETFLANFGVRPEFVTSFVTQSLGLTPSDMMSMGYVQDLYGRWIALDFGEPELVGGGEVTSGGEVTGGGGGYTAPSPYGSPASFRSGYTSGLINWRIGF
jgi:hypothetical protein